jgi:lipopolysaccharide export system protein LptA
VELNWRGHDGKAEPMKVETSDLVYFELEGKVELQPWARMTRGALEMKGGKSLVTLEDKKIRLVQSENASGVQDEDGRKVEYAADHLNVTFDDDGQVRKVVGDQNAHASSTTDKGRTDTRADHVELTMAAGEKQSVLDHVASWGKAVVESKPAAQGTASPADTRVLKSEIIELKMRSGGREIDNVETHAPGTLEFIPSGPKQTHRLLTGEKFWIAYGAENQIQSFRAVKATTRTDHPPKNGKPVPPATTSSEEFRAEFEPKTNQVARIEQANNFRYQEGDRTAQSNRAVLDQKSSDITLTGAARMSDPTGSTSADKIVLNQQSGDFSGEGHVSSTRLPDKKGAGSSMLSGNEPMQAKADRMFSTDSNLQIRYEGHAVAWQGANRIQADRLEIDRDNEVMRANGSVVSQFVEKPKKDKNGKPLPQTQTVFTVVKAPSMVYTDEEKLAHYTGGALLTRPNMTVKAREIRAFLKDAQSDSSLDHAFADGGVVVVQTSPAHTRTGTSEHTEYYAGEEKIVMSGGQPQFVDSLKGITKGRILTYYSNDDRLLVNGVESQRAESVIHRK